MHFDKKIDTVEVHTGGEAFRIVTSGLPRFPGATIVERRQWVGQNLDHIRTALIFEPRGHADMYAGYLTEPVSPTADFGVIFVHNQGYSDHCGHGVIALATAAVELGWVERTIPETRVGIDAPCGFIEAYVTWDGDRSAGVRFINVPSFIYMREVTVDTPTYGKVSGDIAFGGAFYFYTSGAPFGLSIEPSSVSALAKFGGEVKRAANAKFSVIHPDIPELNHIYGTIIDGVPRHPGSTQANCCVFADEQIDRSPTGSGTAGRVAQLYLRGELGVDDTLVNESIIGSIMRGKVVGRTRVGEFDAIVPEVSGEAYVYGFATWLIDASDPFANGFLMR